MTQELVLVVLLTGLVGLVWVVTLSILDGDHPASEHPEPGTSSGHREDAQHQESALKHHTVAA